jgi:DNA-binding CsgD family transcriptional regulator
MHELMIELVELKDFTVTAISNAALRRFGLTAELVIGRPIAELLREEDREASRMALRALRDGVIDFYQAYRHLDASDTSGLAFTAWARSVEFGDEQFALVEMAFGDRDEAGQSDSQSVPGTRAQQRPLAEIVGHDPPVMAIGIADASWVVTSISKDIFQLLGVAPELVIGRQLLEAIDQESVQSLLEADRLINDEYSVARTVKMRDANGQWRSLCCVLTSLAKPGDCSFILLPYLDVRFDSSRASELEQHLFRIAAELDASGILQRVGDFPSPSQHPELTDLTTRQWEVMRRLMRGQRVPTIAAEMFLSQSTIRNHLSAIFERFGVHSQTELLAHLFQK